MRITRRFYKVYPELSLLPDDEARVAVLRRLQRGLLRRGSFWLLCLGGGLINSVVIIGSQALLNRLVPLNGPIWLLRMLPAALLGAGLGIGVQFLWRGPLRRSLREELVSRGVPICVPCGYDLRGQTEPRCPECGRPFDKALLKG